ncbi:MAG: hypothetical protein IJ644_00765 [Oscillospiraceae bacterium]|nr:hypothetical protein [Oscillospiraceae bacterium]
MNKKRILGILGAGLMLTAGFSVTANAETLVGDHNGDGNVDASDAACILRYAAAVGAGNFSGILPEFMENLARKQETLALYQPILDSFRKNISEKWENYQDEDDPVYGTYGLTLENTSYQWRWYQKEISLSEAGFWLTDMNNDGIEELIVSPIGINEIYDLYTIYNDEVIHLAASGERDYFVLDEDNLIHEIGSAGADSPVHNAYGIEKGTLIPVDVNLNAEYQPLKLTAF